MGATGVHDVTAGSKGYLYGEFTPSNPSFKSEYAAKVEGTLPAFGGKLVVRATTEAALYKEAGNFGIGVLIEFPSVEMAMEWVQSDAYNAIAPAKHSYSNTVSF